MPEGMQFMNWFKTHQPSENLFYKNDFWDHEAFVDGKMIYVLSETSEDHKKIRAGTTVISTHTSKSVCLPVLRIELESVGMVFVLRYNFYDWKISVISLYDIEVDFMGLFDPEEHIHEACCEGFPKELVFGPYAENKKQFTLELRDNYHMFAFLWIFTRQVLGYKNKS